MTKRTIGKSLSGVSKCATQINSLKSNLQEAEAKNIQEFVINGAKDAGEKAAEEAFKESLEQVAEEAFLPHILKMCEEEGEKKGQEVFGEFGGQIGKEAAVVAGRKAGLAKAVQLLLEGSLELARTSGGEAGLISIALLEFTIASTYIQKTV